MYHCYILQIFTVIICISDCICLNTSEALTLRTVGVQRQIVAALETAGGAALLHPARLYAAATRAGLAPLHSTTPNTEVNAF